MADLTEWYPLPEVPGNTSAWEENRRPSSHSDYEGAFYPHTSLGETSAMSTPLSQPSYTHRRPTLQDLTSHTHSYTQPMGTHHYPSSVSPVPPDLEFSPLEESWHHPSRSSLEGAKTRPGGVVSQPGGVVSQPAYTSTVLAGQRSKPITSYSGGSHPRMAPLTTPLHDPKLNQSVSVGRYPSMGTSRGVGTSSVYHRAQQESTGVRDLTITSILSSSTRSEIVTGQSGLTPQQESSQYVGSDPSTNTLPSYSYGDYYKPSHTTLTSSKASLPRHQLTHEDSTTTTASGDPSFASRLVPTLTLAELDQLWMKFLTSSLAVQPPENQGPGVPLQGERGVKSQRTSHKVHCTCHRPSHPVLPHVGESTTRIQDVYTRLVGLSQSRGPSDGIGSPKARDDLRPPDSARTYTKSPVVGWESVVPSTTTYHHPPTHTAPPHTTTYHHPPTHTAPPHRAQPLPHNHHHPSTIGVHTRDTSVQTTPSLLKFSASKGPVSFSLPAPSGAPRDRKVTNQPPLSTTSTHHPPTLQEALRAFHPQFINRSEARQQEVKEMRTLRVVSGTVGRGGERPSPEGARQTSCTQPPTEAKRTPAFVYFAISNPRPRMSMKEMYEQSKRHWQHLPEVQWRACEKKRRSQAATNRLRVKLYQKEVLARARSRSQRKRS